jgi:hypothetical protein
MTRSPDYIYHILYQDLFNMETTLAALKETHKQDMKVLKQLEINRKTTEEKLQHLSHEIAKQKKMIEAAHLLITRIEMELKRR